MMEMIAVSVTLLSAGVGEDQVQPPGQAGVGVVMFPS
jgi:hypothetical protein